MAVSTANALKTLIEAGGLGLSVYRDIAPQNVATKADGSLNLAAYVTVQESISTVPDPLEDGAVSTVSEMVQVDLWQYWRDPVDDHLLESYTLPRGLFAVLHGARLASIGTSIVYGVLVRNVIRLLERDSNIVHHAFTLSIRREA